MTEKTFDLKPNQPYIELNKLLQVLKIAQTGGHAKILVQNEEVKVDGKIETRVRKKLVKGEIVEINKHKILIN
jgi:ribosome-associated protein